MNREPPPTPPDRLTLSSRPFIDPGAAREQAACAPVPVQVEAPQLVMPEELPDSEEPGVPLESQPDFEPAGRMDFWWRFIGMLLLAGLPLFSNLQDTPFMSEAESRTVDASQAAADRQREFGSEAVSMERLTPLKDGKPDYQTPPGITWAHLTAGATLDPAHASTTDLRFRARLVSACMGLLTVAAVFWCGFSIGGLSTGTLAGVIFAAMPLTAFYFRQARPEGLQMGCSMLAVAAALWAMRPLRDLPGIARQITGWLLCGLALGAAILVGGPMALPPALIPLLVIVFVCPHRVGHGLGVLAAVLAAALTVTPWAIFVHLHDASAASNWLAQLAPRLPPGGWVDFFHEGLWRLAIMGAAFAVWATWLPGALLQPFSTSSRGVRQRMLIGWSWFVAACVLLVLAPTANSDPATLLTAIPPGAILLGQLLRRMTDLASVGHYAKFWIGTRWVMILLTLALSVALPTVLLVLRRHPEWAPNPDIGRALHAVSLSTTLSVGVILLLIAVAGALFAAIHSPPVAVACWAAWCVAAMTLGTSILARTQPVRANAPHEPAASLSHLAPTPCPCSCA